LKEQPEEGAKGTPGRGEKITTQLNTRGPEAKQVRPRILWKIIWGGEVGFDALANE